MRSDQNHFALTQPGFRALVAVVMVLAFVGVSQSVGALTLVKQFPASDAKDVCLDAPLRLEFDQAPTIGASGKIVVKNAADGKIVDSLDLSSASFSNHIAGKTFKYQPLRVDGNQVEIQLHSKTFWPKQSYQVEIDGDCFKDAAGNSFKGFDATNSWTFTTKATVSPGVSKLVIAADGSGDFCTVQGAVDSLRDDNQEVLHFEIKAGTYVGIIDLQKGRDHYHFHGEDRHKVILTGFNNDRQNAGRTGRALFGCDADDLWLENLTVSNSTPYHGSQAEAVRIQGDKCIVRDCDLLSFQDTVLASGRVYFTNCYIAGDVDFIWGQGVTFFDHCEIKALHDGYYLQTRNPVGHLGYIFADCILSAAPEAHKCWLARIDGARFPGSQAAYIRCRMGNHIPAAGWEITGGSTGQVGFWEYASTDLDGKPLDVSKRHPASRQLTEDEAAMYSKPEKVFALRDDWNPRSEHEK